MAEEDGDVVRAAISYDEVGYRVPIQIVQRGGDGETFGIRAGVVGLDAGELGPTGIVERVDQDIVAATVDDDEILLVADGDDLLGSRGEDAGVAVLKDIRAGDIGPLADGREGEPVAAAVAEVEGMAVSRRVADG